MICVNAKCGREIPEDAVFCPYCGKKQIRPKQKTKSRGNGLGSVYKGKNGKWIAVKTVGWIVDPLPKDAPPDAVPHKRRQTVSKSFDTKKDAMAALPFLTVSARRPRAGTPAQRKKTGITLKELFDQWEPTHKRGRSTMNCYRSGFRVFSPLWMVSMEEIDIDDLQECIDDAEVGRRTLENAKTVLGLVYKYGIPRDCIPKDRNLAQFLRINDPGTGSKKPGFTDAELQKISKAAAAGDAAAVLAICQCYLGFRPTAFLALTVADYSAQEKAFRGGIKTAAGKGRTVTVSPKIQPYVDALVAASGGGYVFGQAGQQLRLKQYRELLYDLLSRLGVENPVDDQGRHKLTPHSCRHTFATLMKRTVGADTDKLALIGHTSTAQLRDYQDVSFADLRAITDQL